MNKQEMFTKAWRGLEAQGWKKSEGFNDRNMTVTKIGCLYRGPHGMKCAAGHLIPDENYRPGMEGDPILLLLSSNPGLFGESVTDEDTYFIYDMQQAHDSFKVLKNCERAPDPYEYTDMKQTFIRFAEYHNLTIQGDAT